MVSPYRKRVCGVIYVDRENGRVVFVTFLRHLTPVRADELTVSVSYYSRWREEDASCFLGDGESGRKKVLSVILACIGL